MLLSAKWGESAVSQGKIASKWDKLAHLCPSPLLSTPAAWCQYPHIWQDEGQQAPHRHIWGILLCEPTSFSRAGGQGGRGTRGQGDKETEGDVNRTAVRFTFYALRFTFYRSRLPPTASVQCRQCGAGDGPPSRLRPGPAGYRPLPRYIPVYPGPGRRCSGHCAIVYHGQQELRRHLGLSQFP